MNPYYDSDKLGWKKLELDQDDLAYEYNTLCFWKTKTGLIFSASDSGCSCPIPFQDYEGETEEDIIKKLERIGSLDQATALISSWNERYGYKSKVSLNEILKIREDLKNWFN